jgi:predicted transcriptional regulator
MSKDRYEFESAELLLDSLTPARRALLTIDQKAAETLVEALQQAQRTSPSLDLSERLLDWVGVARQLDELFKEAP